LKCIDSAPGAGGIKKKNRLGLNDKKKENAELSQEFGEKGVVREGQKSH